MKIVYLYPNSYKSHDGVFDKVTKRANYWQFLGAEVAILTYDSFELAQAEKLLLRKARWHFRTILTLLIYSRRFNKHIKNTNPDIIYTRHFLFPYFTPKGPKVVLEVNGDIKKENRQKSWFIKLLISTSIYYYNKRANLIVTAGDQIGHEFKRINKRIVIPNSILDTSENVLKNFNLRAKSKKLKENPKIICFIAAKNRPFYAIDKVIELINQLDDSYRLWIIGDIHKKHFQHLDLCRTEFLGPKFGGELKKLLFQSTAAIGSLNLSTALEGRASPLKVRTYIQHGLPVFTKDNDCDFDNKNKYYFGTKHDVFSSFKLVTKDLKHFLVRKEVESPPTLEKLPEQIRNICLDNRETQLIKVLKSIMH